MKLTILAVVILALGIVLGLALHGQIDGSAVAAPPCPPKCPTPTATPTPTPPPQRREDQISIFATSVGVGSPAYNTITRYKVALDPADYPPSATYRFEAVAIQNAVLGDTEICVRLLDFGTLQTLSDTEVCGTPIWDTGLLLRSGPFAVPSGEHEFGIAGLAPDGGTVTAARIIVGWTE